MNTRISAPLLLGLDCGTASLGWALFEADASPDGPLQPVRLLRAGVRIFTAGTDGTASDITAGRDASRGQVRREARGRRRLIERRARRKIALFLLLQRAGLLPEGEGKSHSDRDRLFKLLDALLVATFYPRHPELTEQKRFRPQMLPYHLRAAGLGSRLEAYEFGRALYQLAQRRGFLSNRKSSDDEKEEGAVKEAIKALRESMGTATLGEYLAVAGEDERRIRGQWTSRHMFEAEFDALWTAQAAHHPAMLTDALRTAIRMAIFHQRPLKSAKHLVGFCDLERHSRRSPWALPEAQRFRLLQRLGDLTVITASGQESALDPDCRAKLLAALETQGDMTFKAIRKLLALPKDSVFNLERGGETKMPGDRTAAKLRGILGDKWPALDADQRRRLALQVYATQKPEVLKRLARKTWGLDSRQTDELAGLRLEEGYCAHSRKALRKLLPLMEAGVPYATAKKQLYGDRPAPKPLDALPPVQKCLEGLRNPLVARTLSEMRKVVNAICREYGKPTLIRVELARDLKKGRKERTQLVKTMRDRQRERDSALAEIGKAYPVDPRRSRDMVEKYLLALECDWRCPYTGYGFGMDDLFGPVPRVDVEHILPFSRSLDNSFLNKTLCFIQENREVKKQRTPFEAYSSKPLEYQEMIERVKGFYAQPFVKREKLRRFLLEDMAGEFDDFQSRQLNDTRYASRLAAEYLGMLYGGEALRRVKVSSGGVTAYVRDKLRLNSVLNDGGTKTRDDHRHHAVDAVAIALTSQGIVKQLADSARWAWEHGQRFFKAPFEAPWPTFLDDLRRHILDEVTVSLSPRRKVSGPLHEDTFYSQRGEKGCSIRRLLTRLNANEVAAIIDPHIRSLVQAKLDELGVKEPAKVFSNKDNAILLPRENGPSAVLRRVRVRLNVSPMPIGQGERQRFVKPGSNHHMAVYETTDAKGKPFWAGVVTTLFEAKQRAGRKEPVVRRNAPEVGRFLFSLSSGDVVALQENGQESLWRVRSVYQESGKGRLEMAPLLDARKGEDIKKDHRWKKPYIHTLRNQCRKVTMTPLGDIRRDHT